MGLPTSRWRPSRLRFACVSCGEPYYAIRDAEGGSLSDEQKQRIAKLVADVFGARSRESQEERAWSPGAS